MSREQWRKNNLSRGRNGPRATHGRMTMLRTTTVSIK